jgi:arylsulfatase A-like enzyme/cytochrome c-type biogenesis protein CcmH/NrfG
VFFSQKIIYNHPMKNTIPMFLLLLSWAGVLPAAAAPGTGITDEPLNVLLITIDTWRFDRLGCNRPGLVHTPHLDAMAARGVNFTRAFAHNPETLPSHANMMTGATALTHGVYDNNGFKLHDESLTLAEHLRESGYRTFAVVASFVLSREFGISQGFDEYVEPAGKQTSLAEEVVAQAMRLITQQQGRWFGWIHLWDPHSPYSPPAPFAQQYRDDLYSGEVAYVDDQLGKLFALLERRKILSKTLLIVTGDHGEGLGEHGEIEHGFFAYNSTIHVPLFIVAPGVEKRTSDSFVCHIDLFPTVCQAVRLPAPRGLQGVSLLAPSSGGVAPGRAIYFESKAPYFTKGWAPLEGYIQKKMKYIDLPIKELYDLDKDLHECKNIISRAKIADLDRTLQNAKNVLAGKFREGSTMQLSPEARQKLETFGYLSGFKQEKKSRYGREDDLKTLLPLQNMLLQAKRLFFDREYSKVASLCEKVLAQRPEDAGSIILLSDALVKMNQMKKAVGIIRDGLVLVPQNMELKVRLGGLLADSDASEQALELLNEVLRLQPQRSDAWIFLGIAHFRRGEFGKALAAYEKALALEPGSASAHNNLGTLYLTLFLQRKSQDFLAKALDSFHHALDRNSRMESAYNGRGTAYKFSGKNEEAIADWKKAIELNPGFIDPYFNIGIAYLETGRPKEALHYLNTCLARHADRLSPAELDRLRRLIAEANRSN